MLESLLSISQHFTDDMPVGDRKEWQRISAATADLREKGEPKFNIDENERGNILLAHDEEFWLNAWIRLPGKDEWLQISYRRENYPALEVSTITVTDEALATHIRKAFGGGLWHARKLNIDGVEVEGNHVVGQPEGGY
jgi:hypothetical protein